MSAQSPAAGIRIPNVWHSVIGSVLNDIRVGDLTIAMPGGETHRFVGAVAGPVARIDVRDAGVARRILMGGDIALAETYMAGMWDTPDLDAVLDLGIANLSAGWAADVPFALRPIHRAWCALRDNDPRGGAKRNIAAHYDLGNEFYELWLDETMTYSSACLAEETEITDAEQLERAQVRKWDRILELIQPTSSDRLLEIGCGWGGFAIHAARESGCSVTGLTLSEEQAALARERVREEGLEGQIDIRLQDYRHTPETFTGIASIEMFEAVGEKWWPVFFDRVQELLEPGKAAAIQVITIAEQNFDRYRRSADFTRRYIFPGGMLPSPERFKAAAEGAGLTVRPPAFFGHDYARTLAAWASRFEQVLPQVRELGFDERFIRMWRFYLSYCRAGFDAENIDVMQIRLEA